MTTPPRGSKASSRLSSWVTPSKKPEREPEGEPQGERDENPTRALDPRDLHRRPQTAEPPADATPTQQFDSRDVHAALKQPTKEPARPPRPEQPRPQAAWPVQPSRPARAPWTVGRRAGTVAIVEEWAPWILTGAGFGLFLSSMLTGVDLDDIGPLGLIDALPLGALAGAAMLIGAFFLTFAQSKPRNGLLAVQIAAITVCLHGAAALVEPEPRFATAWLHAGFAEYIAREGATLPGLDARMSWPGFFAITAFVSRAAGVEDLQHLLSWAPLLANFLYLLPFAMILRRLRAHWRAKWLAALLFVVAQWVGQDYFSPQGTTYFLYLTFIAICLTWFGRVDPPPTSTPRGRIRRFFAWLGSMTPGELPPRPSSRRDRIILLCLLVAIATATVATHQITPFMLAAAVLGLILVRRCTFSFAFPFLIGALAVTWLSYVAIPFWAGHLDDIFGGIGNVVSNVSENTTGRISESDPAHAVTQEIKLYMAALIVLLSAIGFFRRLSHRINDRVVVVLMAVPLSAIAMQSYGGEMGLRIYFFMLPGAAILAAYAFFPAVSERPVTTGRYLGIPAVWRPRLVLAAAIACVFALMPGFYVARYANEAFEMVRPGEAKALDYIYDHSRPTVRAIIPTPETGDQGFMVAWGERDVERAAFLSWRAPEDPANVKELIGSLRVDEKGIPREKNTYLLVTKGQLQMLELDAGFPPGWGDQLRAALDRSRALKAVYRDQEAAVYALRDSRGLPAAKAPDDPSLVAGTRLTGSVLTASIIGAFALVLLVVALIAVELVRLRPDTGSIRSRARRRRQNRLLGAATVVFVILMAVVVVRFIVLGIA